MSILRIIVLQVACLGWSVLGLLWVRKAGVDLKNTRRWNPKAFAIAGVVNLGFVLTALALYALWDHQPLAAMGWAINHPMLIASAGSLLSTLLIAAGFVAVLGRVHPGAVTRVVNYFSEVSASTLSVGLFALFMGALQEEVLFRSYTMLNLKGYGIGIALVAQALLFAVWHVLTNKVHAYQLLWWLEGGLTLGAVYLLSGSVWVATFVHLARNLANGFLLDQQNGFALVRYDRPLPRPARTVYYGLIAGTAIAITWVAYGGGIRI